nr:uncharacterized protein LOC124216496 [Neodiprion pinetum]
MSSEKEELKCVFCNKVKNEKLLIFSEESMSKCQKILRLRKIHKLKYKDVILPDENYDLAYHSSCYKAFTALKRQFYSIDGKGKVPSQSSTSLTAIEQPSTSADTSIIDDTIVHDSLVQDVNLPETEVEKEIDAEAEQPLEERPPEDSAESSTTQIADTVAPPSEAAAILRAEIKGIKRKKLPQYLTSQRLIKGERSTPPLISEFFSSILGGYRRKRRNCDSFQRHVNSLSQDIIYMTEKINVL